MRGRHAQRQYEAFTHINQSATALMHYTSSLPRFILQSLLPLVITHSGPYVTVRISLSLTKTGENVQAALLAGEEVNTSSGIPTDRELDSKFP